MYHINDRSQAIKNVQKFLMLIGTPEIFVAQSGVFDENTRLSTINFQKENELEPTGIVDAATFDLLYKKYEKQIKIDELNKAFGAFITFPILPGYQSDALLHINRTMGRVLDYYGYTHRLRESNFYSGETAKAVSTLQKIYQLPALDGIDETFYMRLLTDHNSVYRNSQVR